MEHKHKQTTKHKYEQANTCTHNKAQTQKGKVQTLTTKGYKQPHKSITKQQSTYKTNNKAQTHTNHKHTNAHILLGK